MKEETIQAEFQIVLYEAFSLQGKVCYTPMGVIRNKCLCE